MLCCITIQALNNELPEQPTCHPVDIAMIPKQFFYLNLVPEQPPEMKAFLHCNGNSV